MCVCVCVLVTQACPTLCTMNCHPPGCSVHQISQSRILEWVAISSFRGSSWSRDLIEATCLAGRFFTVWATREVVYSVYLIFILSSINGHLGCFYGLVGSSGGSDGKKNLAWNAGDAGLIPGLGSYLDKGRATHSSILSWRIPWTEEPGGLQSDTTIYIYIYKSPCCTPETSTTLLNNCIYI